MCIYIYTHDICTYMLFIQIHMHMYIYSNGKCADCPVSDVLGQPRWRPKNSRSVASRNTGPLEQNSKNSFALRLCFLWVSRVFESSQFSAIWQSGIDDRDPIFIVIPCLSSTPETILCAAWWRLKEQNAMTIAGFSSDCISMASVENSWVTPVVATRLTTKWWFALRGFCSWDAIRRYYY